MHSVRFVILSEGERITHPKRIDQRQTVYPLSSSFSSMYRTGGLLLSLNEKRTGLLTISLSQLFKHTLFLHRSLPVYFSVPDCFHHLEINRFL